MELVAVVCPRCGGPIQISDPQEKIVCSYCGTQVITQEAVPCKTTAEGVIQNKTTAANIVQTEKFDFKIVNGVLEACYIRRPGDHAPDIVIPDGVKVIGASVFTSYPVESISMPDSVTEIGYRAFATCHKLTKIKLSSGLITIGDQAFEYCDKLKEISIPQSLKHIGSQAFAGCTSLTSFDISNKVETIGSRAFCDCTSLTSFHISHDISNGLESIGGFEGCSGLTTVTLPEGLKEIAEGAFKKCENLREIRVPSTVNKIGSLAFAGCQLLTTIHFAGDIDKIELENHVFNYCQSQITKIYDQWYQRKRARETEERKKTFRQQGLCQHCGGTFEKKLFSKVCRKCKRKKDY